MACWLVAATIRFIFWASLPPCSTSPAGAHHPNQVLVPLDQEAHRWAVGPRGRYRRGAPPADGPVSARVCGANL
eukprot:scaffold16350_cov101-Isochrysis_galbana.AAC.1